MDILSKNTEDMSMFFSKKCKRVLAICMAVLMITQWGALSDIYGVSVGSNEKIYPISDVDDLRAIIYNPNGSYMLTNDIDLSEVNDWEPLPIAFNGKLNGNGYVIRNMTSIGTASSPFVGLFQSIGSGMVISDLGFENITLGVPQSSHYGAGAIASNASFAFGGTIENVYVTGKGTGKVSGLLGTTFHTTIRNCYASLEGTLSYGGIVEAYNGDNLIRSYYNADVTTLRATNVGNPKTADELKLAATFEGWDFTNIWQIKEGESFPTLVTDREPILLYGKAFGEVKSEELHIEFVYSNPILLGSGKVYVYRKNDDGLIGTYDVTTGSVVDNILNLDISAPIEEAQDYYILADEGIVSSQTGKKVQGLLDKEHIVFRGLEFQEGNGTIENPYLIYSVEDLERIREGVDFNYRLMNDLDLSTKPNFMPIGSYDVSMNRLHIPFTGTFDGNGYTIHGLTQEGIDYMYSSGLFGYSQGDIMNLGIVDVDISSVATNLGQGGAYVAGLVGVNEGRVTNCYSTGRVTGTTNTGGLVGNNLNGGVIDRSYSEVDVYGKSLYEGSNYYSGEYMYYTGGLAGRNALNGQVVNCYATGDVEGGSQVGGLIGNQFKNAEVRDSYALGNVKGYTDVGGFVGRNYQSSIITNAYSTGHVSEVGAGTVDFGGLVGERSATLNNGYYDSERSGQIDTGKGEPKTKEAMQEAATFVGFDFTNTWMINQGRTTPYFASLVPTYPPAVDNHAPTIDAEIAVIEDTLKEGTLSAVDLDGDTVTFTVVETTSGGALTVKLSGDYTYMPYRDVTGTDRFVVALDDGYTTTEAAITIHIQEVDDLPMAIGDDVTVDEDSVITGVLPIYDVDGGTVSYGIDANPKHGDLSINAETGAFLYEPEANYYGKDVFRYAVSNGISTTSGAINVTVHPVNDAPVADNGMITVKRKRTVNKQIEAFDIDMDTLTYTLVDDVDHGTLNLSSNGEYSYYAQTSGLTQFSYQVSDGTLTDTGTITIKVKSESSNNNQQVPPTINPDADQVADEPIVIDIEDAQVGEDNVEVAFVPGSSNVQVQLNVENLQTLQATKKLLEVKTDFAHYIVDASKIDIDTIQSTFGQGVSPSQILVSVHMKKAQDKNLEMNDALDARDGLEVMSTPVEFEMEYSYNGKTVKGNVFTGYIRRLILIPEHVNPADVTTAVVIEANYSMRPVPTKIVERDGRYYAEVHSRTNSTYVLIRQDVNFSDMHQHWSEDTVYMMASRLIVQGKSATHFEPDAFTSRAEFITMVVKAMGLDVQMSDTQFSDVKAKDWYYEAVQTGAHYGLASGYNQTYRPNDTITREEACVILSHMMHLIKEDADRFDANNVTKGINAFSDQAQVAPWAVDSVELAAAYDILQGKGENQIKPKDYLTRAEAITFVHRVMKALELF